MDQVFILQHVLLKHAKADKIYGIYLITNGSKGCGAVSLVRTGTHPFPRVGSCPDLSWTSSTVQ